MSLSFGAFLLFYAASMAHGFSTAGQPPRFILEPQDAVLPTAKGTDSVTASIHCSHDTPNTTLVWFRNGVALTYTDTRILHNNGTVEFRPLIALVDVSAEGVKYQCMLSNAFGSVVSRIALLQSATFGSQWNIADAPTRNVDVTLGSFIRLPCDPPPANPPPNVVWMQDDKVLDTGDTSNKYKVLAPEAGSGLIIARVNASDIGPVYRCRVTNALVFTTRDSPFSHQLRQIDRYPENLTIYNTLEPVYTLATGSDAEFTCLALANDVDTLEFLFIRTDGGTIPDNVERTSHDATTILRRTTMSITSVTEDNAGEYRCVVRNFMGGNSIALGDKNFTIQVSVAPAITSVPGDTVFYTGDTETLECNATGFPAPVISYYFNATLITSGVSNGVLTLDSVGAADTGPYQCFADNVRADQSALWVVTVRDPSGPVMLAASNPATNVPEKVNITLTANFSADPEPTAVWQLDDGNLPAKIMTEFKTIDATTCPMTYQAVLTVTGFDKVHSGTYELTVENRAGSFTQSFERILEIPATVNSLTGIGDEDKCIVRGQDSNLTCTFSGTPQPQFMWYTKSVKDGPMNLIPGSNAEYVVYTISSTETILGIRTVGDEDDLIYGCQATNIKNGTVHMASKEFEIDICAMPSVPSDPPAITVIEMQEVIFRCESSGEPTVTNRWFYTNTSGVTILIDDTTQDEFGITISEDGKSIKIMEATEENAGDYICEATAALGKVNGTVGTLSVDPPPTTETPTTQEPKETEDFPLYVIIVIGAGGALILLIFIVLICCAARYYYRSKSYIVTNGVPHRSGRDEEDDNQAYDPQYESLPAATQRPSKPPDYKPTPDYPSGSVITSRSPVHYNGSSSMMEMQKMSNTDLTKNMYNYNSTSALTKQDLMDGVHQPRYEDFLSSDGQFV